jgi:hypothetical protein
MFIVFQALLLVKLSGGLVSASTKNAVGPFHPGCLPLHQLLLSFPLYLSLRSHDGLIRSRFVPSPCHALPCLLACAQVTHAAWRQLFSPLYVIFAWLILFAVFYAIADLLELGNMFSNDD